MAGVMELICPTGPAIYFSCEDWTGGIALIPLRKFVATRKDANGILLSILERRLGTSAADPGKCPVGNTPGAAGKISAPDRSLDRADRSPNDIERSCRIELADNGWLGEGMVGVHHDLKPAWRFQALAVHGLTDRIDVGCAGLADSLHPHPKADEGRFHRVICRLVALLVEVRPHLDECCVFRRLHGLQVASRRHE